MPRRAKNATTLLLLGLLAAAPGCTTTSPAVATPETSLDAYATALQAGRIDVAYDLLSAGAKRTITRDAFRKLAIEHPDDTLEVATSLRNREGEPVVTAEVVANDGQTLKLVLEDGEWRIDGNALDRYSHATPRLAIEGFVRAFDRSRFDILLRYAPVAEREGAPKEMWKDKNADIDGPAPTGSPPPAAKEEPSGLTVEALRTAWTGPQRETLVAMIEAIRAALPTAKIEETGDRAVMPYGAGGSILLTRENGDWKIEDLR